MPSSAKLRNLDLIKISSKLPLNISEQRSGLLKVNALEDELDERKPGDSIQEKHYKLFR